MSRRLQHSSAAELCARILKSLAEAAWCLWRVLTVFTRSAITPVRSEAIWIKIGALWVYCLPLALARDTLPSVTCRITLNHPSTAAMHLMSNYFHHHLLSLDAHTDWVSHSICASVAQITKRLEPSTVLWAFHTIQPSSCLLKEAREVAVVKLFGRLFHARVAVTRKERSPMVRSRVLGTIRRCREPDRSRRSDSASSVHWRWRRRYGGTMLLRQRKNDYGQSKLYSFRNSQPVEVPEKMCDVVVLVVERVINGPQTRCWSAEQVGLQMSSERQWEERCG